MEVDLHPAASMTLTLDVGGVGMPMLYHALLSGEHYAIHMYSLKMAISLSESIPISSQVSALFT